jgi:hypothetical protein
MNLRWEEKYFFFPIMPKAKIDKSNVINTQSGDGCGVHTCNPSNLGSTGRRNDI